MQAVPAVPARPGWKARLARTLGLDGNPLRRASDRAEAWIRAGLLVIFLTAGPLAALAAGQWTAHAAAAGTGARPHAVQAVLLQPATAPAASAAAARGAQVLVPARWPGASGSAQTGEVPAPAGAPAGTVVTVWLNASGRVAGAPPPGAFAGAPALVAIMTLTVTALALLIVLRLTRRLLDWRRLAAWEVAWRTTGPRWTDHRS
jgi:hypothetical protein